MEKLNYLRQDKKIPGKESFVTYVDFQVKDGTADMWLYDIFPGVQLMVVDFSSALFVNAIIFAEHNNNATKIKSCSINLFISIIIKVSLTFCFKKELS